jgi:hypothetical protein
LSIRGRIFLGEKRPRLDKVASLRLVWEIAAASRRSGRPSGAIAIAVVPCRPEVIVAIYEPLAGVRSITEVTGFLWWSPATSPYRY